MILLIIFTCLALTDAGCPGGVAMTSNCAQAARDCISLYPPLYPPFHSYLPLSTLIYPYINESQIWTTEFS